MTYKKKKSLAVSQSNNRSITTIYTKISVGHEMTYKKKKSLSISQSNNRSITAIYTNLSVGHEMTYNKRNHWQSVNPTTGQSPTFTQTSPSDTK